MRTRAISFFVASALACALLLQSSDLRAGEAKDNPALKIRVSILDASGTNQRAFDAKESITFELVVENTGDATQNVVFASTKTHDFVVTTKTGREIWRASKGLFYGQMLTETSIATGETQRYSFAWNQVCGDGSAAIAGEYRVEGFLATTSPHMSPSSAAFTIR